MKIITVIVALMLIASLAFIVLYFIQDRKQRREPLSYYTPEGLLNEIELDLLHEADT